MTITPKQKSSTKKINFALIFLVFIILLTIGIYGYNFYIESENEKLETRISTKTAEIAEIKKDKNIQVYALKEDNKKVLNKLERYSDISKFMDGLTNIERNYGLILDGFNYSNGVISTKAVTNSERVSNAYLAISDFIEKYRKRTDVDFNLPYISRIVGNSKIAFNLKLEVKDNLTNNKK